ncbi:MAG: lamin tail domain-containing protein, partial [Candidatus Viridilinea halotolerans]
TGITIAHLEYNPPGRDRDGEYVLIRNSGATSMDLTGWTLSDGNARHSFTFPRFSLAPGAEVKLWTRSGNANAGNLFWASRTAIWNKAGDTATLCDASGNVIARYTYQGQTKPRGRR